MRFLAWPHFSLISAVDILLVAVIIYELLTLIRGTRAAYMLVGVAALALAFYFSRLGDLTTLNWMLSTLLPYGVFALIVVFQGEIHTLFDVSDDDQGAHRRREVIVRIAPMPHVLREVFRLMQLPDIVKQRDALDTA